jgi:hypothetical protein
LASFPECGYVYVAFGQPGYLNEVTLSVASLRRTDLDAHVTLITNEQSAPELRGLFDHVVVPGETPSAELGWKHQLMFRVRHLLHSTPYERAFAIDGDTYFIDDCRPLFGLLQHYDLCMAHGTNDRTTVTFGGKALAGYTPYNMGVMLFRVESGMRQLFDACARIYAEKIDIYPHDQPAFMEALLQTRCRVYVLQNNYNARTVYLDKYYGRVMLLHGRHRDLDLVAARINITEKTRIWVPSIERCLYPGMPRSEALKAVGTWLGQKGSRVLPRATAVSI